MEWTFMVGKNFAFIGGMQFMESNVDNVVKNSSKII